MNTTEFQYVTGLVVQHHINVLIKIKKLRAEKRMYRLYFRLSTCLTYYRNLSQITDVNFHYSSFLPYLILIHT